MRTVDPMTDTEVQPAPLASASPITVLLGVLVTLGLARVAARALGLLVLAGIVLTTVVVLAVGILVLRISLG
jgi:hypothetical protein